MTRTGLKMEMVRSRGPAEGAVVVDSEIGEVPRQVSHIDIMMPYGLGDVFETRYDEMAGEDRLRVHRDVVLHPLSPGETHGELFWRPVGGTQETRAGLQ